MKLLINLCAHDGIISHYTGVGTIVDRYIQTFNYILSKMKNVEYKINLITPEYNKNSFGYSYIYDKKHRQLKNIEIIQISNESNGKINYGTIIDWKKLCENAKEYIDRIAFDNYDLVLTICNDTPFACLNNIIKDASNHYKVWIPHSTGKIHKVDSAVKDSEKMINSRIEWEYNAICYINTDNNSYLAGTSQYISKHLIKEYNLDEKKLIQFINGELLDQNTFYEENEKMKKLFKKIENEENIIFSFGRAEEYKNLEDCMYLGKKLNIKPVVIAQPYFEGQPIIKKYKAIAKQTDTILFINAPFDFPFYILNYFKNNMIMLIPSKKEIFGLIINQVRKLNKNNILIVANDIGGLHEQISDCEDGILVNLNNIDESANKIRKCFNNEYLIKFNENSQQKLKDSYNFEKICFQFLEFFMKL